MREILFRGLRTDGEGWAYGHCLKASDGVIVKHLIFSLGISVNVPPTEVVAETVGQFVGKLDKNKNKIFLGDLIKHQSGNTIYQVAWSDTRCGFVLFDKDFDMVDIRLSKWGDVSEQFEVIGNIHEVK